MTASDATTPVPVVRDVSWSLVALQTAGLLAAVVGLELLFRRPPWGLIVGASLYLAVAHTARALLTPWRRRGWKAVRECRWTDAERIFADGLAALDRRPWIDRWRALVILDASRTSLRSQAMTVLAVCRLRQDDVEGFERWSERALSADPRSRVAASNLATVRTIRRGAARDAGAAATAE